ncbi:VWA domain-containing protein [Pseudoduganella sp. HUAS MS19]
MPEAEDVITDAARFAFDQVQRWRSHKRAGGHHAAPSLKSFAERLDLLLNAAYGRSFRIHQAQTPLPRTMLARLLRRGQAPPAIVAVPATDGWAIWLPSLEHLEPAAAFERYRTLALLQAMRAVRGAPAFGSRRDLAGALFHVCEAWVSAALLQNRFPGLRPELDRIRTEALAARPDAARMHGSVAWIELAVHRALHGLAPIAALTRELEALTCTAVFEIAEHEARQQAPANGELLQKDLWLGDFRNADGAPPPMPADGGTQSDTDRKPRRATLARRPDTRPARDGEDGQSTAGAFVLQTAQPHEKAEDPMGLQRPADQDNSVPADDLGDALSELPEARLVSMTAAPAEVLAGEEPLTGRGASQGLRKGGQAGMYFSYPEWDYRSQDYAAAGSMVLATQAGPGDPALAERIVREHAALLDAVRRGFQLLGSRRSRFRRQLEGDDIDIEAWVETECGRRAGADPDGRVFETQRQQRRDLALLVLVDISGSTDGWISGRRRVIDVEREALLLLCHALDALGDPFSVLAFSGESRTGVVVREIKGFAEAYGEPVALRIAGIEPEQYTRTGSAVRHATCCLSVQPARHRLLLLLTDGKPNDIDLYEGRYGLQDLRQSIMEAQQQGISPFCLAIDHQSPHYLGQIFGTHQFAILPRTDLLAAVLLSWLRKLIT